MYLHEQVLWALEDLIREKKLPRPFFTERCALVYLHHYQEMRDSRTICGTTTM